MLITNILGKMDKSIQLILGQLKISIILWFYGTIPEAFPQGPLGGAERAVWEIARRLAKRNEVSVLCTGSSESQIIDGVELRRIRSYGPGWLAGDKYFYDALFHEKVDIVHSITAIEPSVYTDRVILHLENDISLYSPFPLKARFYSKHLGNFKLLVGVSNYVLSRCLAHFDMHDSDKIVLHNGADVELYNPKKRNRPLLREKYGISEDDIVVIHSGHMGAKKGLDLLLEANERHDLGCRIIVAGGCFYTKKRASDERFSTQVYRRIGRNANVTYAGAVGSEELSFLYASSDILVVPSIWEDPCPLVVAEGAASGLPVIGTTRGGIPELIHEGKTGLVIRQSSDTLAQAVTSLVNEEKIRRRMSRNVRNHAVKNLNWDVITAELERKYKAIP